MIKFVRWTNEKELVETAKLNKECVKYLLAYWIQEDDNLDKVYSNYEPRIVRKLVVEKNLVVMVDQPEHAVIYLPNPVFKQLGKQIRETLGINFSKANYQDYGLRRVTREGSEYYRFFIERGRPPCLTGKPSEK